MEEINMDVVIYPGGILWWICALTIAYILFGIGSLIVALISAITSWFNDWIAVWEELERLMRRIKHRDECKKSREKKKLLKTNK